MAVEKFLIVGPAWVGDMVMAQSLFKTLQRRAPGAVIDVLAPAWSAPLLRRMPEVRQHIELAVGHGEFGWGVRRRIGHSLRGEKYSRAIILPRSFKAALVPFFARIPRRIGYRGEWRYGLINDMRPLDKCILTQTVQRYVALGLDVGAPLPPAVESPRLTVDAVNQQRLLEQLGLNLERPVVGFVPGAEYGPAKRWPTEYFARLAEKLAGLGCQVWLFGSSKDLAVCDEIQAVAPGVINLAGKTRLEDAIDLIALTRLVVTNDSGLMHIAAAMERELIAVYGSSSPGYTPPLTGRAKVIYLNLECSPCFERECPLGHYRCLREITVEQVFDECKQRCR
ncbi:MAG: lipopolysaccharide heptosyltransferase II [Gammaproteobacteria bacterium]|nr:lipopolysaccharide heptosyltransferase II [Gammaproteobacteria bacterium]